MKRKTISKFAVGAAALAMGVVVGALIPSQKTEAASPYYGITVDGNISDWDAVEKHGADMGVSSVAFVFDGDYLYVLIDEPQPDRATWSGERSSGNFVFTTDLGYNTLIQLKTDNGGCVYGVDGAIVGRSDQTWGMEHYYWEIAVPASCLGPYNETVSFGHYCTDEGADGIYVRNVANISGSKQETGDENSVQNTTPNPGGTFQGVTYDGNYDDWAYYPHTVIQYDTSGTNDGMVDAQGAVYSANGILYGHVKTSHPEHLSLAGSEYTEDVFVYLNGSESTVFKPYWFTADGAGNINWFPQREALPYGTYEFYLANLKGWASAGNLSEMSDPSSQVYGHDQVYGKMIVTIGPSCDETEYWLDIALMAADFGMTADEVKTIGVKFGRIGNEILQTAGTSTGAALGVCLCLGVVGCGYLGKKRKTGHTL